MGSDNFDSFYTRVTDLLKQPGVAYYGAVSHEVLATAYASAGFLLYPTQYPETGCITVQKAMASGAIPITSKYVTSVLPSLTVPHDMGPSVPLRPDMEYMTWLETHWIPAVIKAATTDSVQLENHRARMKGAIRQEYTWRASAEKLVELAYKT
jgi:glycosyltransferase involved in cell wall biosynthesis